MPFFGKKQYKQNNKPKRENTKLPSNWRTYCYDKEEPDQERLDIIAHCTQVTIYIFIYIIIPYRYTRET